jgi:hypothetical protein
MFEDPEPTARPEPKRAAGPADAKPKWTRYRPKNPVKCDRCMAVHAETGGKGPLAAQAKFSRTAGGVRELLCYQHTQAQRARDGMPEPKGTPRS